MIDKLKLVSRQEATERGLHRFFTGISCIHGHISERRTKNGVCVECTRMWQQVSNYKNSRRERMRIWQNNPEELRKCSARQKTARAYKKGLLGEKICVRCGSREKIHAHHDDYSKPLDIMWLCPLHHKERHRELEQEQAHA